VYIRERIVDLRLKLEMLEALTDTLLELLEDVNLLDVNLRIEDIREHALKWRVHARAT